MPGAIEINIGHLKFSMLVLELELGIDTVNRIIDYRLISYRLIGHIGNRLNRSIKPVFVNFLLGFLLIANWAKNQLFWEPKYFLLG
jgi:hypothetical protein